MYYYYDEKEDVYGMCIEWVERCVEEGCVERVGRNRVKSTAIWY